MSDLPHVRVVRGTPDDVELAALVAGLVAATATVEDPEEPTPPAAWSDRGRGLRGARSSWRPGPDTWRWSAR
jgi:hypothetical protein